MDWINDFIKHLTISMKVSFALAVTCLVLLFGPIIFPEQMDSLSKEWKVFAYAGLAFSVTLLVAWAVSKMWSGAVGLVKGLIHGRRAKNLTDEELAFICMVGKGGTGPYNLTIAAQNASGLTKLQLLGIAKALESKGLIESGEYDETVVWLTSKGRVRAINELQKL